MNQEERAAFSRINEARNVFHHHQDTCLGKQQHSLMVQVPSPPLHGDQDSAHRDSSRSFTSSGWRAFLLTLVSSETSDLLLCGVSFKFTIYLHRDSLSFLLPLCHFKVFHYPLVLQCDFSSTMSRFTTEQNYHPSWTELYNWGGFSPSFLLYHSIILWFRANSFL